MTYPPSIFTTLGMFIIDEIRYPASSGKDPVHDIIGGGGTYATFGSRVCTTRERAENISWIIDKGSDFPIEIEEELESWGTRLILREDNSRLTTRGLNVYDENELRSFSYLTPKKRIEVKRDFVLFPELLNSRTFHLICTIDRCIDIVSELKEERLKVKNSEPPIIAWEPLPDDCNHSNLEKLLSMLHLIDIFTPNLAEAASFLGRPEPSNKLEIEGIAKHFLPYLTKMSKLAGNAGIVIRCGAKGCFIKTPDTEQWLPAYHNPSNDDFKVIDPTGGGNTFVGSFTTAFYLTKGDWKLSGIFGNIASGIAIEVLGIPKLTTDSKYDIWNGVSTVERINKYVRRNQEVLACSSEKLLRVLGVQQ